MKEGLSGIRLFIACYLLWCALGHDSATAFSAFGAEVDNPIGGANDIIGKAVVVHKDADDFKTQPAGNSGARIACGVIAKS